MSEAKTGLQVKAERDETKKLVDAIAKQMNLRQWCVEQAVKCSSPADMERMINLFYDFVTKQD